jgi:CRISPR-associated endonuclease/helicase Cas3
MLHQLVTDLGCTIVLASATQPTLDHRKLQEAGCALPTPRPITPTDLNLAQRLQRVRVSWPEKDQALGWVEVAALMTARPAALGVVNTTRAARELFQVLKAQRPDDAFHLSAKMCPAHRMEVLQKALDRIKEKRPCYLISTQLIEAGVDVDFPMVLRELAPFDAIIQAAGRCNREGLLNGPDGTPGGELVVFRSRAFVENQRRYYPQGYWYKQGLHVLEQDTGLYLGTPPDVHSSADLADYFTRFYYAGDLDREQIQVRRAKFQFAEVATHYRIIEDSGESVLVTNWPGHTDEVAPLLAAYEANPSRANLRRLAPYQVNVRFARKEAHPLIDLETYSVPTWTGGYDADTGLADERDVEDFLF